MIAAGDVIGLEEAIDESDDYPNTIYTIYLEEGEYLLPRTLVVRGTVKIYGAGADTTILRQVGIPGAQGGSMNTMIKVPGISLTLDNVTLTGGRNEDSLPLFTKGGAISVESASATLTVTNAKFIDNKVHKALDGYGGAIYSNGVVTLRKVYFEDNKADYGGAIALNANPSTGTAADIELVDFKLNTATTSRGGAIDIAAGTVWIANSNFRQNISTATNPVRQHVYSYTTVTAVVDARTSYWNNPTVPSSANEKGVNTLNQLASKATFVFDDPTEPPPCGARGRQLCGPTPTPTALPDIDCSDGTVDLIPMWLYAQTDVQELTDMLITIGIGVRTLAMPTLSSVHTGLIDWGTKVKVYARVQFPQTGFTDQIWYRVSTTSATTPLGWIPARYENVGLVSGSDPCAGISAAAFLTTPYDRFKAANYAIEHSYQNESLSNPCAGNRVTRRLTNNQSQYEIPFADFVYSNLDCGTPGATGSAVFISEAIWAGGLPMTSPIGVTNDCDADATTNAGWCMRTIAGVDTPSNPWDKHEQIVAYFTTDLAPSTVAGYDITNTVLSTASKGSRLGGFTGTINPDFFASNRIGIDPFFNNDPIGTTDFNDSIPSLRQGVVTSVSNLGNLVGANLSSLQMGDYILIDMVNTNGAAHGLFVIGWGPIEDCEDALTTRRTVANFTISRVSNNTVPHVVDFTGGAMSPIPRPFYCSIYSDQIAPGVGYFNRHDWYFYRTINEYSGNITINLSQLYVHPDWQWSATSGH